MNSKYNRESPIFGNLLQEVDKSTVKEKIKDAPNPDHRFSNSGIQCRLENFRGNPKPPPLWPPDDFDLPSLPSGNIEKDDKRLHPLLLLLQPPSFQRPQLPPREIGQMAAEAPAGEKVFKKKVSNNILKFFLV